MAHFIWNDNENTYVITGRLGERVLAIRSSGFKEGIHMQKFVSIDDDVKPDDVVFIQDYYTPNSNQFYNLAFLVFIAGKPVNVTQDACINFTANPYVEPANMLSKLGRATGIDGPDNVIMETILTKLEYLKILEDHNLLGLVRKCYDQSKLIDKLNANK